MKNRCVAVLNYGRNISDYGWLKEIIEDEDTVFMFASNGSPHKECDIFLDISDTNVATARNMIINKCKIEGIHNLHMVDDDIEINDISIFEKYENLSIKMDIPYINNGYTTKANLTLGIPNPRVRCMMGRFGETIILNPHINNGYSYYDINGIGDLRYDENLNCMEDTDFIYRLIKTGRVPFFNFFFDIDKSWEYINIVDNSTIRNISEETVYKDQKYLIESGMKWEQFNLVDTVIEYIDKQLEKGESYE